MVVNINSPGGDVFEGVAIYNLLRAHGKRVTVNVVGLAASAASVIAMAGDEVLMGDGAFLMIHNAWTLAIGNRHDLRATADQIEPIDEAMAQLYAARSGMSEVDAAALMDKETWLNPRTAVEIGLADGLMPSNQIKTDEREAKASAVRRVEAALRASGMPQAEAKKLISEFKAGLRDVPGNGERDAASNQDADAANIKSIISVLTRKNHV